MQSWNGHPELSLPHVAMETTFLPRLHPYRLLCLFFYCLSISPSLPSMLFIPLSICVSVSLDFCHFCMRRAHACDDASSAGTSVLMQRTLCGGEWPIAPLIFAFQCTWTRKHLAVFAASLYFYSPFCSAPCFSNAPSSHCICPHTGHLSIISSEF